MYSLASVLSIKGRASCIDKAVKVITLANHNGRRQSNEPIRTQSKYLYMYTQLVFLVIG